jgi:hypothetical protein
LAIRYRVTLTDKERFELENLTKNGKVPVWKCLNARALLLCDTSGDKSPWTEIKIAEALGMSVRKIEYLKKRFVEHGLEAALGRKRRETPPREIRYDGAFDARLMHLACSPAPEGHTRWTVRLLSEKVVALDIAPSCSPMAVCRSLKKTTCSLIAASTGKFRQSKVVHL